MKPFTLALVLLVAASSSSARQSPLKDGLYVRSHGTTSLAITTQDGERVLLQGESDRRILQCKVASQDNANSRFYVSLRTPYTNDDSRYVLIVSGIGYESTGGGASKNEWSSIGFAVRGDENAEQIARAFKSRVLRRAHPGHHLLVSYLPSARQFSNGDEVTVTLRIVNVGANTIAFQKGGRNRAARDNQYVFSARLNGKQVEDIGSSYDLGGLSYTVVLRPGEAFEDRISLNKWFRFDRPGTYEIHGGYNLGFDTPTNELSDFTIWEDYASADFQIVIREPR